MKLWAIWALAKQAYAMILRDALRKLIDDPDNDYDDFILDVIDRIFEYEEGG